MFFEIFATGGVRDTLAVWRYNRTAHAQLVGAGVYGVAVPFASTAPLSALPAYIGTGLLVFGCSFHLSGLGLAGRIGMGDVIAKKNE